MKIIYLYFANVGAGKTTFASKIIQKEYKKQLKGKSKYDYIFCNAHIKNSIYIDIPKVLKHSAIKNSLLIIDEASIEYNNRLLKMTKNEIEFFKLHRHYKTDIIIISQSYEDIDITLRRMYGRMFLIKPVFFHISMIREIKKYITIDAETEQIIEGYKYTPFPKFFYRRKWYKFFDSFWTPEHIPVYEPDVPKLIGSTQQSISQKTKLLASEFKNKVVKQDKS